MENTECTAEALTDRLVDTYDFRSSVEQVKAIDQALRHYFNADHWLAIRNRLFPGLRTIR
jgi:predicted transcriptional regulator